MLYLADRLSEIDVCMCVCICVFLYVCLSVCAFVCVFVYECFCMSDCLCICLWLLSSCTLFYHQLNIDKSLELQGPFDLILHKCTLFMVDAEDGDEQSLDAINNIKVIDSLLHINNIKVICS